MSLRSSRIRFVRIPSRGRAIQAGSLYYINFPASGVNWHDREAYEKTARRVEK